MNLSNPENNPSIILEQPVYLVGFMGAGKSTIAKELSRLTGAPVMEMDEILVQEAGKSIPDIFKEYGEDYFRTQETSLLARLSCGEPSIVSCGGGTAAREDNIEIMKDSGTVVLLDASPQTILDRVRDDHNRPLLEGKKTVEDIASFLEARMPAYLQAADFVVRTDDRTAEEIALEILAISGADFQE